jgi:hypothetical protein
VYGALAVAGKNLRAAAAHKTLAICMALLELRGMNSSGNENEKSPPKRANILWRLLGPGLVTGAADDDPSGIATYSQAGAQFGYGLLWTVFLTTPFMIAIQLVSAHIGRVTGKGIVANVKDLAPRWVVVSLVSLLVLANTFNIAADLAARQFRCCCRCSCDTGAMRPP